MSLALIAALPFLGALLPGLLIRSGRDICALATGAVTALALLGLLLHAPDVIAGRVVETRIAWLPLVGLDANFRLDGLGLLFGVLILGIGLLIILYARFYLAERDPMGQFYAYLMLFQGAMTGIVLSDNILFLLVFWELTSLSSFLLIGYWKHLPEGRRGARMALAVTGGGGLAMIAGMLILGHVAGTYDISGILGQRAAIQASGWYVPALLLILAGAFAKSAQFPLHFWLPQAMSAPTPVSAYLHSATMVKAGLFLMARLWPVLAGTEAWFYIVATTGLVTMILGAAVALFKDDLKALLAYSTVSHLGLVTMLLGFGTPAAAVVAVFHIINHATFKAALFMCAGIVEHETGTRDIARLGGLRRLMPLTFAIVGVTRPVDGGDPAPERLPLQGDDARRGDADAVGGQSVAARRDGDAGGGAVGGLFAPHDRARVPRPRARRLSRAAARPGRRALGGACVSRRPRGRDRVVPDAGRRADRGGGRRGGDRTGAEGGHRALARLRARAVAVARGDPRRRGAGRTPRAGIRGLARDAGAGGGGAVRARHGRRRARRAGADRRAPTTGR